MLFRSPKFRLPLLAGKAPSSVPTIDEQVAAAGASLLVIESPTLAEALPTIARFAGVTELDLTLGSNDGLDEAIAPDGTLAGRRVRCVRTRSSVEAARLLAHPAGFEVAVALTRDTAPWLLALDTVSPRLALYQPTYERLTENGAHDVDLRDFFATFAHDVPVEGVPACVTGRPPRVREETLDTTMMLPEGRLEIFHYAKRYILDHYRTKSLRCRGCSHAATCDGMHVNYVRAHGYGVMQPVTAAPEA